MIHSPKDGAPTPTEKSQTEKLAIIVPVREDSQTFHRLINQPQRKRKSLTRTRQNYLGNGSTNPLPRPRSSRDISSHSGFLRPPSHGCRGFRLVFHGESGPRVDDETARVPGRNPDLVYLTLIPNPPCTATSPSIVCPQMYLVPNLHSFPTQLNGAPGPWTCL